MKTINPKDFKLNVKYGCYHDGRRIGYVIAFVRTTNAWAIQIKTPNGNPVIGWDGRPNGFDFYGPNDYPSAGMCRNK